jgi:prevent-host-death family protein
MDRSYNIHETKTNLSRILNDVSHGECFIIARSGKPIARIVPIEQAKQTRRAGILAGKAVIPKDIKKSYETEVNAMFYGNDWVKAFPLPPVPAAIRKKRGASK